MHLCTFRALLLPRSHICTSKAYSLPNSHAFPLLNLHIRMLKVFWLQKQNCIHAYSGISEIYTYTNFVRNLGYLLNKVLHFMPIQVFLLPKTACKFKYFLWGIFLHNMQHIYILWDISAIQKITCTHIQVSCFHIQRRKSLKAFCYLFYTYMFRMNRISKHLGVRKLSWRSP